MNRVLVGCIALCIVLTACEETYTPKPHGYPRIDFPEKEYTSFSPDCGFSFDVPVYATVTKDQHPDSEPCWYNINYLPFDATLHLSYKSIGTDKSVFDSLTMDSYTLVYKHTIKAEDIVENLITKPESNVYGIMFDLAGQTATSLNFHVSDSNHHFIRGALYFNNATEVDSVAPVLHFLRDDVLKLIESLTWKE